MEEKELSFIWYAASKGELTKLAQLWTKGTIPLQAHEDVRLENLGPLHASAGLQGCIFAGKPPRS